MKLATNIEGTTVSTDVTFQDKDSVDVGNELVIAYDDGPGDVRLLFDGDEEEQVRTIDRLLDALNQVRSKVLARVARS